MHVLTGYSSARRSQRSPAREKPDRPTLVGEAKAGQDQMLVMTILRSDLSHRVLVLEGHVKVRVRDINFSSAEQDREHRALALELPLTSVDDVAQLSEIPVPTNVTECAARPGACVSDTYTDSGQPGVRCSTPGD